MAMRRIRAIAALVLIGASVPANEGAPLPVHVGGRTEPDGHGGLIFGWPGIYFEGRFRGTAVTVTAIPNDEQLAVLVDGERRRILKGKETRVTIGGLKPGAHVVRLEKLTESQSGRALFLGMSAPEGGTPLPPEPRARRIEFIGDSHSVGYGNTSAVRECTRQEVHDTTDTQQAFGPLLAKKLGADYRVIAYSGYGIVRNYNGAVPGDSLPRRYARAIPGEEAAEAPSGWQPDWVVINLGSNDFSTPLHAGEAWKDAAALHAHYRASYARFVRMLLAKYPKARLLLMRYEAFDADVEAVVAAVADPRVATAKFGPFENTGCDWHPSLKDHRDLAEALATRLAG
jgi:lysophospholipase L1-like esterase